MFSHGYDAYQAVSRLDDTESFRTDQKTQETITTVLTTMSYGPHSEFERLLDLEKRIKRKMKSPLFDNAITAMLAMISMFFILLELRGLFKYFSLDDAIDNNNLCDNEDPLGAYNEKAYWLTGFAIVYSFRTLKYSIDSLPDEIIGELSALVKVDVSKYNKTSMLAIIKTLIHNHEKTAMQHSEADLYLLLNNIRVKLDKKLAWYEKLVSYLVWGLRGVGFVSLIAGITQNKGDHNTLDAHALFAYLVSGLSFDLAFLIKLGDYYVPSTGKVLNETELNLVKDALKIEAIHKKPADHTIHEIRRHSMRFFSTLTVTEEKKEERKSRRLTA
jgi:hypothetical protein